ncbi:MAG: hypothetical protein V5A46_11600, partial [Haloferacaceae archaeon]
VTTRTETDTVTVEIEPEPRFEVESVGHDVPLGGEGTVTLEVTNAGDERVTESTASVTSSDSDFYFGSGTATSEANVGVWGPGETRTLRFRAGTVESAVAREYPVELSVQYTDGDGAQASESEQLGITPGERTRFEVEDVDHDVPENGEGTMTVSVEHTEDKDLSEVTVTASTADSSVYIGSPSSRSAQVLVDDWDGGDEEELTFRIGTTEDAVDRTYPVELEFDYTDDDDNDNQRTEVIEFSPGDRDQFEVGSTVHDVPRDGEGTLVVNVTQIADEDLSNVSVTASTTASDVYLGSESSRSSTTMVGAWGDEETRRLTFRVGTTEGAVERTYPIDLEFDYTDDDDNDNARTKHVTFVPRDGEHFAVERLEHTVPRDGIGTVTVAVTNAADRKLEDVSVTASTTESELYVGSESSRSGTATVSEWGEGETRRLTFRVGATGNAVDRPYPLELSFQYSDADDNDNSRTKLLEFAPDPEPQFAVQSVDHDVPVGGTGSVAIELRNEGPVNATETTVTIGSGVDALFFGAGGGTEPVDARGFSFEPPRTGTPTSEAYVGDWPVGETRTVYFRMGFDEDALPRNYVADLTVDYDNVAGDDMPDRSRSIGVEPLPEPQFRFETVESDLYVGEEGDLVARVTNAGDRAVDGVVVTVDTERENVNFYNRRHAVGRLEPGESTTVRYRAGVTEETEHGPRLFELSARYRDVQEDVRYTGSRDVTVRIRSSRDAFALETREATFAPGESGELVVTVTNRRNETLTDIQAKLFTDDPLDSEDDSAFVPELEPGESATMTMDVSVGEATSEKVYSASMDFRFDDSRGESQLSDTYRVPVTVREPGGLGGPAGVPVAAGLAAIAIGGALFVRRTGGVERVLRRYRDRFRD